MPFIMPCIDAEFFAVLLISFICKVDESRINGNIARQVVERTGEVGSRNRVRFLFEHPYLGAAWRRLIRVYNGSNRAAGGVTPNALEQR
jgi:hypothetical protein